MYIYFKGDKMIKKILIANRGEIALRIIRACKELGIKSVAIFSEADLQGVWLKKADECYPILADPIKAYLDYEKIVSIAKKSGCDAIHPGYGFLSEDAKFAKFCEKNGIIFIGPKPKHIELFGDKIASKKALKDVGIPVLPGGEKPINDINEAIKISNDIGFPIIIKAAFGGGGKGMRIVENPKNFKKLYEAATKEAKSFFGKGDVFIEKYIKNPRHIEVQIVADKYGNVVHLGERDCSIQRKHQKVIEVSPSPNLNTDLRKEIYRASQKAMFKLGYESVGTMEFLVDDEDNFYFIEMNTRIQVEHTITEAISGIDLVQRMIEIAGGDKLKYLQEEIMFNGYAIEFRINAENPKNDFSPSPGKISEYFSPGGPGIRLDTIGYKGYEIQPYYDSMIGKLIVWGKSWKDAVYKSKRALDEFIIRGVSTNIPLHRQIVRDKDFIEGKFDTGYLDKKLPCFSLDAIDDMEQEDEKMQKIADIIKKIKAGNLKIKY